MPAPRALPRVQQVVSPMQPPLPRAEGALVWQLLALLLARVAVAHSVLRPPVWARLAQPRASALLLVR